MRCGATNRIRPAAPWTITSLDCAPSWSATPPSRCTSRRFTESGTSSFDDHAERQFRDKDRAFLFGLGAHSRDDFRALKPQVECEGYSYEAENNAGGTDLRSGCLRGRERTRTVSEGRHAGEGQWKPGGGHQALPACRQGVFLRPRARGQSLDPGGALLRVARARRTGRQVLWTGHARLWRSASTRGDGSSQACLTAV